MSDTPSENDLTGRPPGPADQPTLIDGTAPMRARIPASVEAALAPLSRVGDYELLSEIGRGGMGVVFKARHLKLNRLVALKMILGGSLAHQEDMQRFHTEAEAAAQLQHSGIVALYEVGTFETQPYFCMEYVSGSSLALQVAQGPLPGRRAASYMEIVARAVHYAHTRGILHRDLKPANVLLDTQDQPKITDFGLAKLLATDSGQTRTGAVLGTPSYMSPEQAAGRKDLGPAADVWSLGAILYELLTGKPPFKGETALATLALVAEQEPAAPRLLNPAIDRELETICLKCLEKDEKRRYHSAEALADDLRRYLQGEPISARRVTALGRTLKWARRKPAAAALLGVSLLSILVFVIFSWRVALDERELRLLAEANETRAQQNEDTLRQLLYFAKMRQAQDALRAADHDRADQLLAEWAPRPGRPNLRDWEWYFLKERARGRFSLAGHDERTVAVVYRPDGKQLASAGGPINRPGEIKLWDAAAGKLLLTLTGHKDALTAIAFSADGRLLASASHDQTVRLWNPDTGAELATLAGHGSQVTGIAFRPDGLALVAACANGTLQLWTRDTANPERWERTLTVPAHPGGVTAVAYGPKTELLASAGQDRIIKFWDAATLRLRDVLPGPDTEINSLAFSHNGQALAAGGGRGSKRGEVRFYETQKRELLTVHYGLSDSVLAVAFSRDGKLAAGGSDGLIRVWDQAAGSEPLVFRGEPQIIYALAFSPDGVLACAGRSGRVRLYNATGGQETAIFASPQSSEAVTFSADSHRLAASGRSADGSAQLQVWDAQTQELLFAFQQRGPVASALAFAPDGQRLVATADRLLRVYDLRHPHDPATILTGHTGRVTSVAFHPAAHLIASASEDDTIRLWNSDGSIDRVLNDKNGVLSVAFSPDGRYLVSGGYDCIVRVWDLRGGGVRELTGHSGSVNGVAFSADGTQVASASKDKTIRVWDLTDPRRSQTLQGPPSAIASVAFQAGGLRLASAGHDDTIRLWDLVTGQEILELQVPAGPVRSVAFSPDGRRLACAGPQIPPRLWEAQPFNAR